MKMLHTKLGEDEITFVVDNIVALSKESDNETRIDTTDGSVWTVSEPYYVILKKLKGGE